MYWLGLSARIGGLGEAEEGSDLKITDAPWRLRVEKG